MNGKQLKNSILQWAIQGKLVPQDPNDEPASVLLERIRAERKRLIKEGKIKKDKNESIIYRGDDNSYYENFPDGRVVCIDDEIPFEIPQSWEWARLGCIVEINPRNHADESNQAGFIPMTYIEAGYGNHFRFDVRKWKDLKSGFTHLADGDVAFAKITPCFQNRKSMILADLPNGIAGGTTELNVLRVFEETLNREYLLYFIKSHYFIGEAVFKGTAGQQRVRTGYTESKLIPIPPFSEQERIVAKINKVLPMAEKYELSQNHLNNLNTQIRERLKKSILQEAIKGKLVYQDSQDGTASELISRIHEEKLKLLKEGKLKKKDILNSVIYKGEDNKYYEKIGGKTLDITEDIPFDLPESWSWCRLSSIVHYRIGKTPARGETAYWEPGTIPWVSISDMKEYGVVVHTKESVSPKAAALLGPISPRGTLLMSFKLTVGRTAILDINAYHNEAIISIWPFLDSTSLRSYLFHTLPILANLGDSKDAIKGKTLNTSSINNLLIPLPPSEEQIRIVNRITELYRHL